MTDNFNANDLEVDGEVSTASLRRIPLQPHDLQKSVHPDDKHCSQDRIDSGIGSISFQSNDSVLSDIRRQIHLDYVKSTEAPSDKLDSESSVSELSKKLTHATIDSSDDEGIESFDPELIVSKKCTKVTDRLTEEALEVYGRDADGDTLLHIAVLQGNDKLTREFIRLAPWSNWLDIYNEKLRQTPLHLAAHVKNATIVRALVVGGADVEARDHNGDTPLHIACRNGHMPTVAALLKPITAADTLHTEYEFHTRCRPQNLELRNADGYTCTHLAAENGHLEILQTLISSGSHINTGESRSGATVLHTAAYKNDVKMTKFLLRHRSVNVNKSMYNGTTPYMVAHERNNSQIVELLDNAGAVTDVDLDFDASDDE